LPPALSAIRAGMDLWDSGGVKGASPCSCNRTLFLEHTKLSCFLAIVIILLVNFAKNVFGIYVN